MSRSALFRGLVVDDHDRPVDVAVVGDEAFYVVDDEGFHRHIDSEYVDRQVLQHFQSLIDGNEDLVSEGTMKMIGQDDIFTKAAIEASLKDMDSQFDTLLQSDFPDDARQMLGMMGFRVVIDLHGDVIRVEQPEGPGEYPD